MQQHKHALHAYAPHTAAAHTLVWGIPAPALDLYQYTPEQAPARTSEDYYDPAVGSEASRDASAGGLGVASAEAADAEGGVA